METYSPPYDFHINLFFCHKVLGVSVLSFKGDKVLQEVSTLRFWFKEGYLVVKFDRFEQGFHQRRFSTWMAFGGNTHDLGSFGEETNEITDLHQILEEVLLTKRRDGVASIKRRHRDLFIDDVWNLEMASGRGRLEEDLESST
ncbi:hypothetical protein Tco_0676149 [Tanacetum coccineum]